MRFWGGKNGRAALVLFLLILVSGRAGQCASGGVLVWHFDQGVANRWGGKYNVYSSEPSWARTYLDPNVHRPGSKHSLRVTAHREVAGFCGVWLDFYPTSDLPRQYLDASSYRYLSFWIKGQKGGESLAVTLLDDTWQQPGANQFTRPLHNYLSHGASTEWQEVLISTRRFPRAELAPAGEIHAESGILR